MRTIIVDLDGADLSASELLQGALDAFEENEDLSLTILSSEDLKEYIPISPRLKFIQCEDIVTNLDQPTRVMKTKPHSSLVQGIQLAKDGDGFVSVGNTGAVLVSSMFILGRIKDCRPALTTLLPSAHDKQVCLVDCGANVDCKVEHLFMFAKMGEAYQKAMGIESPRIGLLSNGVEEKKGSQLVKDTHILFKTSDFNFIGNVEATNALNDTTDVIVADGFNGNLFLKTMEGTAKILFKDILTSMKEETDPIKIDTLKNLLLQLQKKYNFNDQGGAVLLGVPKVVVKGHGAASKTTIQNIIRIAYRLSENELIDKINQSL